MSVKRIDYIDIAKAIGILIVLWSHTGAEVGMMTYLGGMMIPVFFIVSGFTYKGTNNMFQSLGKKLKRLIIPHFIFSLLLLLFFRAFHLIDLIGIFYSRYSLYPLDNSENLYFFSSGNPPIWFLTAMFTAYVIFEIYCKTNIKPLYVYATGIISCFFLDRIPILLPWSIDSCFLFSLFIYTGYKFNYHIQETTGKKIILMTCIYVLTCYINGYCNLSVREYGHSFLFVIISGVTGTMIVVYFSKILAKSKLKTIFTCIGKHSLVIFCTQSIAIRLCNKLMFESSLLPYTHASVICVAFIKVFAACILGITISLFMKKYLPFIKI